VTICHCRIKVAPQKFLGQFNSRDITNSLRKQEVRYEKKVNIAGGKWLSQNILATPCNMQNALSLTESRKDENFLTQKLLQINYFFHVMNHILLFSTIELINQNSNRKDI